MTRGKSMEDDAVRRSIMFTSVNGDGVVKVVELGSMGVRQ